MRNYENKTAVKLRSMATGVVLAVLTITAVLSQYQYSLYEDMPQYIKKALLQKNRYKVTPRETKRTITNLTLTQVFDKIKDITKALNIHAKKNGYFVDYNFRILGKN